MATEKDLMDLVGAKKYSEALTMLQENPILVNAKEPHTNYPLLHALIRFVKPGDASQALMEHIVAHPQLDFSFKTALGDTNQSLLISLGRSDLIEKIINKNELLFIDGIPTYITGKDIFAKSCKAAIRMHQRKNPGSAPLEPMSDPKIVAVANAVAAIREATIKYAVENDDADLLIKLKKDDGDSADYQPGGKLHLLIVSLAKSKHVKVTGWLAGTYPPPVVAAVGVGKSPLALFAPLTAEIADLARLEMQQKALAEQFAKEQADLMSKAVVHATAVKEEMHAATGARP